MCTIQIKVEKRAYTGIEPVTSRTLSENHTTRPAGLVNKQSCTRYKVHSIAKTQQTFTACGFFPAILLPLAAAHGIKDFKRN